MRFVITRTSDDDYMEVKEISTMEELINFKNENGEIIIKSNSWYGDGEAGIKNINYWYPDANAEEIVTIPYGIEIYDYFRE